MAGSSTPNTDSYLGQSGPNATNIIGSTTDTVSGFHGVGSVQAAHIADASVAHALNSTFSDTEVEAALNALGAKINAILLVLEGKGQTATS